MILKIGNVLLPNNIILAPMAGVTDLPFRLLCKEQCGGLAVTEMVSAKGVIFKNANTQLLLRSLPEDRPISLQLFGGEPHVLAEAAWRIDSLPADIIDINMGCPVPKIVKNGEGSALMRDPALIGQIIRAVAGVTKKPVTIKIRKGFFTGEPNAVEVAKIAEANGAAAVTVHGRYREQYYSGEADWEIIRAVKEGVSIPVIGNGDVKDHKKAAAMLKETGCDGVMIGRAVRGNPWILKRTFHYLETGEELPLPNPEDKVKMALKHVKLLIDFKGERVALRETRKHLGWYMKGLPQAAKIREGINRINRFEDIVALLKEYRG